MGRCILSVLQRPLEDMRLTDLHGNVMKKILA
jgi:hypothetical protein